MKKINNYSKQLMFPKNRREYTEAFLEVYSQPPWKDLLIKNFGEKYYLEVMKIHQERLSTGNFNLGPQSIAEWEEFKKNISR